MYNGPNYKLFNYPYTISYYPPNVVHYIDISDIFFLLPSNFTRSFVKYKDDCYQVIILSSSFQSNIHIQRSHCAIVIEKS